MKKENIFEQFEKQHTAYIKKMLDMVKHAINRPKENWPLVINKLIEVDNQRTDEDFFGLMIFLNEVTSDVCEFELTQEETEFVYDLYLALLKVKRESAMKKFATKKDKVEEETKN